MRAPDDPYPESLNRIIRCRIAGDEVSALAALTEIRFEVAARKKERWPSRTVIAKIYARDHYQCRYCRERLILTPIMRLVSRLYPEQFPYHPNWKADCTHPAFITRSATLDHVVPLAAGGDPVDPDNLVTACWGCNRRKGDLRLEEIGWSLVEPSDQGWNGLTELFYPLWQAVGRPAMSEDETWWMRTTRTAPTATPISAPSE